MEESGLLERVAKGDENAFTLLVDQYSPLLHTFLLRITGDRWLAEEAVQDAFVRIWLNRESLRNVQHFKAYLFVVSKNFALKALQKALKEDARQGAWQAFYEQTRDEQPDREPALALIDEAITRLPPQQAKVWTLSRRKGLSYMEIATELGISSETVKKHLQAARQFIIRYVESHMVLLYILLMEKYF
ncbi:sigma-70 family RNA polymerase sigma factor [Chitinophaga sedimenti]|uniref:RNA polymerase sigma factor n=1 Tax=Chitinophaga sedimenti TaxID=2033606 RepID=UPI002004BC71|nr:sigma-70 family RNA polymerase sigma factor [Chitinophaga sedimenti]MCK7555658.1 sigma-70 family RNA polymerase sigma factor [Chitinophaga sedimenti]